MTSAGWARKGLHLAVAGIPVAWAYGVVDGDLVRNLLTVAFAGAVVIEALRRRDRRFGERFNGVVGAMLKPREREGLTGATWLAAAALLSVLVLPTAAAQTALWAAAAGDAAAAIVGSMWRRGTEATDKSAAGALACAVTTALGVVWLTAATWPVAVAVGVVAALAEWPARWGDDNARVALAAGGAAWLLGIG